MAHLSLLLSALKRRRPLGVGNGDRIRPENLRVLCIGLDGRVVLPDQGHSYCVAWTREIARPLKEYVVIAESPDGKFHGPVRLAENAVSYVVPSSRGLYPLKAAELALKLHAEEPFDVCTTEDPIRAGLAGMLFSTKSGVPLNVENHSFHINEPIWLNDKPHHRIYNRIAISVVKRADTIRNYSPEQNNRLQEIGVAPGRIFVVPPPAPDLDRFAWDRDAARARFGIAPDECVVLAAGRMVTYKNMGVLLEAMTHLLKMRPARLLCAGSGPAKDGWIEMGRTLGLGDAVTWLDHLPESDVGALYAACDVFVAPAVHETGPRTVLEALQAERPSVATSHMGVVQFGIIKDRETGLVVEPDDARGMAESIDMLLSDPAWGHQMACLGRKRMLEGYQAPQIARYLADVFAETVRRAGGDGRAATQYPCPPAPEARESLRA